MATDSTLQKIADNLLAQFDKTLLDNSTDWIEEDVAVKGQRVFGIICLNDPTKDLIEKVKADDQMRLFEYSISYSEII